MCKCQHATTEHNLRLTLQSLPDALRPAQQNQNQDTAAQPASSPPSRQQVRP